MKIKDMAEQPRQKALQYGIDALSNVELVALIIENGTKSKSAYDLAMEILKDIGGIEYFDTLNLSKLTSYEGIKEAKAIRLLSIIELAKRIKSISRELRQVSSPIDVYNYFDNRFLYEKQENFYALYLDTKNKVIREKMIFKGSLDTSVSHPREVFKEAVSISASRIIVVHNHPSGDASPSADDIKMTKHLMESSRIIGIPLIDHIIIGKGSFYSFEEHKLVFENEFCD